MSNCMSYFDCLANSFKIVTVRQDAMVEATLEFEKAVKNFGMITEDMLGDVMAVGSKRYDHIQMPNEPKELKAWICTQCGAPLHGHKCEYCGTEFI